MTASYLDLFFLIVIILVAIIATVQGFIKELFGKGAPVVAIWIALIFYKKLAPLINNGIKIYWLSVVLSLLAIFIVAFLLMKIIQKIIEAAFDKDIFNGLDHFLGFIFGLVEGVAIVVLLLLVLSAQPWFDVSNLLDGSLFYKYLKLFIASPADVITNTVNSVKS